MSNVHKVKKGNVVSGLICEMDLKVVIPSLLIVLAMVVYCIVNEDTALDTFSGIFDAFVIQSTSLYLWYPIVLIGIGMYFIFSKYGNIVLGSPDEKPATTNIQYIAIILAMAFGATIMRTGPINWALAAQDPPPSFGVEAFSREAIVFGNSYSMFAWGISVFAIFALAAPTIGYYMHVRKKSSVKLSAILGELFGEKFEKGILGKIADLIFVVSFICAAATLVGLATPVVSAVFARLLNIRASLEIEILLTVVMVIIFTVSACLGLKKGIEKLSEINIYLACGFMALICLIGPGLFIADFFTDTIGHYLNHYIAFSFHANSMGGTVDYVQSYTVFWSAYNAGWAILHSTFLAIVSKGRTIRQMLLIYFLAPQAIVLVFTAILGGLGADAYLNGVVPVFDMLASEGVAETVTSILQNNLPFSSVMMLIYMVVAMIFLSTTMDSSTYTIASYVTLRDLSKSEPSRLMRLVWAALIASLAISMMIVGGLAPLDVLNGMMGVPIMILQGLLIRAGFKMMKDDKAYIYNVRKNSLQREIEEAEAAVCESCPDKDKGGILC